MPEPVWIRTCFSPSLVEIATSKIMNTTQLNFEYLDINSAKTVLVFADLKCSNAKKLYYYKKNTEN